MVTCRLGEVGSAEMTGVPADPPAGVRLSDHISLGVSGHPAIAWVMATHALAARRAAVRWFLAYAGCCIFLADSVNTRMQHGRSNNRMITERPNNY